jgi:hypothetical protein
MIIQIVYIFIDEFIDKYGDTLRFFNQDSLTIKEKNVLV